MASQFSDTLIDDLVECGIMTEDKRAEALREQQERGGSLCEIVVAKGMASERQLLGCFARRHAVAAVGLERISIETEVFELIPETTASYYHCVPIGRMGTSLTVAIVDPLNIFALDDLGLITSMKVTPVAVLEADVTAAIQRHYHRGENYEEVLAAIGAEDETDTEVVDQSKGMDVDAQGEDIAAAPVIKLVNVFLTQAIEERASDIHIEPFEKKVSVRYRIDGVLHERTSPPFSMKNTIVARIKVMSNLDISEHRLPQDGRIKIRTKGREIDFRISTLPTAFGEKVVMRVLDKGSTKMDIDTMDMEPESKKKILHALDLPHGMIIVTGPTGSGKTTTLYSCLNKLNSPKVNIVTAEDPIEYQFPGINQCQVNAEIQFTFAAVLRSVLRQDPDIVMVGEVRDFETADIAVKAALTGHLVLTTLHTNSAAATFARIVDMGVEPFLAASAMHLVMAQRLGRRLCAKCKKPVELEHAVLDRAQYRPFEGVSENFHQPVGCQDCRESGYRGRVALLEVLEVTEEVKRLIVQRADANKIKDVAVEQGMLTLRQCALWWAAQGVTTVEEALRVTAAD